MKRTDLAPVRPTRAETVIRHPNAPAIVLFGAIAAVSWLWIFAVAHMYGPGAWMMAARWDATHALLIWIMRCSPVVNRPTACALADQASARRLTG